MTDAIPRPYAGENEIVFARGGPARDGAGKDGGKRLLDASGVGGDIELLFGGMKKSGHRREKGFAAPHDVSALRTTIVKHG